MVLNVPPSTKPDLLHKKYLELAEQHHPDKCTRRERDLHDMHLGERALVSSCKVCAATEQFAGITAAYTVLKDKTRRCKYDALLKLTTKQCTVCKGAGLVEKTVRFTSKQTFLCINCNGTGQQHQGE